MPQISADLSARVRPFAHKKFSVWILKSETGPSGGTAHTHTPGRMGMAVCCRRCQMRFRHRAQMHELCNTRRQFRVKWESRIQSNSK